MNNPTTATINDIKVSLNITGADPIDSVLPDGADLEYSPDWNAVVVTIRGRRILKTGKPGARTFTTLYARATEADDVELRDYPQWIDDLVDLHQPSQLPVTSLTGTPKPV